MPILSRKQSHISPEARRSELVLQSAQSHEADYIVYLEFKWRRPAEENRMLELLYDSVTRRCAEVILNLEQRRSKSLDEINLYQFLLNSYISEDVRFFLAAQYRKQVLLQGEEYIPWFDYESDKEIDCTNKSPWYPPEACEWQACMAHLTKKTDQTFDEKKLIELLLDENTRDYVMEIMILSSLLSRLPYEERYLELLCNSDTRIYAKHIVKLEFLTNRTAEEERWLRLLYQPTMRAYAEVIMLKKKQAYKTLSPEERDILMAYFLHEITPKTALGRRVTSTHVSLSFLAQRINLPSQALLKNPTRFKSSEEDREDIIVDIINKQSEKIVKLYLKKTISAELRTTDIIIQYQKDTQHFLSFTLTKYFYDIEQKFSEQELEKLVSAIMKRMHFPPQESFRDLVNGACREVAKISLMDTTTNLSPNAKTSSAGSISF